MGSWSAWRAGAGLTGPQGEHERACGWLWRSAGAERSADGVRGRGRPGVQWGLRKLPRRLRSWGRGLPRRPFRRGPRSTSPPALPFPGERADPRPPLRSLLPTPGVTPCPPSANVVRLARLTPGKEAEVAPRRTRLGPAFPARALPDSAPGLGKPPRASARTRARAPAGRGLPTGLAGDWLKPPRRRKEPIRRRQQQVAGPPRPLGTAGLPACSRLGAPGGFWPGGRGGAGHQAGGARTGAPRVRFCSPLDSVPLLLCTLCPFLPLLSSLLPGCCKGTLPP